MLTGAEIKQQVMEALPPCPYEYGPLDFGPPGGLDYGEGHSCPRCALARCTVLTPAEAPQASSDGPPGKNPVTEEAGDD